MFAFEFVNKSVTSNKSKFSMQMNFIGCIKNSENMKDYINFLSIVNSKDFVSEQDILGISNQWLENNNIMKIDGMYI